MIHGMSDLPPEPKCRDGIANVIINHPHPSMQINQTRLDPTRQLPCSEAACFSLSKEDDYIFATGAVIAMTRLILMSLLRQKKDMIFYPPCTACRFPFATAVRA